MKKSEVRLSYHQGSQGRPMVNVKSQCWEVTADEWTALESEFPGLHAWCDARSAANGARWDETLFGASDLAARGLWDSLEEDTADIWPDHAVKVYSEGRSGGWAVVEGLPDVEEWDAIAVGRWARFARYARNYANDWAYMTYWQLGANVYEPERERIEAGQAVSETADAAYWRLVGVAS